MRKLRCWWLGCEGHPQDPAPVEYLECTHCGEVVSYEDMAGITRWSAAKEWGIYWLYRKWWPKPCVDCGKRYGHHHGCMPF